MLLATLAGIAIGIVLERYAIPRRACNVLCRQAQDWQPVLGRSIRLRTREFVDSVNEEAEDTELDATYAYHCERLDLARTALVLIDVWQSHPNDGWMKRAQKNISERIIPLVQLARENGLRIIHAPHGRAIADGVGTRTNELHLDKVGIATTESFDTWLQSQGITTLIYAGYASNWCVLHRPVGIIRMKLRGYRVLIVRDCTIAIEMPETLQGEWANRVTINMIENHWGRSTTLADLSEAFREAGLAAGR